MAHINYNGAQHKIPDAEMERITTAIKEAMDKDEALALTVNDDEGDPNILFISRGVPVSVHGWDPLSPSEQMPFASFRNS
ncbi:hypothetical protein [Kocuria kalidii]|uniref:hypothetical protein n=1 Tax=Kocuria kalidii TaxID=3376283 RepID=UPI0037B254CF